LKGLVLTFFEEMVIEDFGLDVWTSILEETGLEGVYTAAMNYPDDEIIQLVGGLSGLTGIAADQLVMIFGTRMFPRFVERYPQFIDEKQDLLGFLHSVNDVIHMEVRKLYPGAALPEFAYEQPAANILLMNYKSSRQLCGLAIGLIQAAAAHYKTACSIEHHPCMLTGADHCGLKVTVDL
jgi:hypothetical protein